MAVFLSHEWIKWRIQNIVILFEKNCVASQDMTHASQKGEFSQSQYSHVSLDLKENV